MDASQVSNGGPQNERSEPTEDSVRVVCRFRPLNSAEERAGSKFIVKFPTEDNCISIGGKVFLFDKILKPDVTQDTVYQSAAKSIVEDVLNGYNGTIFAYGQTSSGKTHTMEGVLGDSDLQGIIPRIVNDIFNHIYAMDENLEFHIKVSYFEIYLDKIRDLLDPTKVNLAVHEDKNHSVYVKGATERFVASPEEVFEVIEEGKSNRHVAVTNMNEHSSRSHSVFLINVKQENLENQKKLSGKLYLVDLAGSEKVAKTGAEGQLLDEARNINKSLSALGNVISALADGNKSHIPYRDSKLTRILQESLGGNAKTTIVICCSPASFNEAETKSTLEFGKRAKTIKNVVAVNEELTADEWKKRYERERDKGVKLKAKLDLLVEELKKWRSGSQSGTADALLDDLLSTTDVDDATSKEQQPTAYHDRSTVESSSAYEAERERIYAMLDAKDDEIQEQSQLVEKLKQQMLDQEELIASTRADYESLTKEMSKIQTENESAKDEVKDVLQALEELAVNYDQKSQEAEQKGRQFEAASDQMQEQQSRLTSLTAEAASTKEAASLQRKRVADMMAALVADLADLGRSVEGGGVQQQQQQQQPNGQNQLSPSLTDDQTTPAKMEEEFAVARLTVSKVKSEVKSLVSRNSQMTCTRDEEAKKVDDLAGQLAAKKLVIEQQEAKVQSLTDNLRVGEGQRRKLQEEIDSLNEEMSKLRVAEKMSQVAVSDKKRQEESDEKMRHALELQIAEQRDQHQKQVADLRNELEMKTEAMSAVEDELCKATLALQQLRKDHDRLREEEGDKSRQLNEMVVAAERRESAKRELQSLEETVAKEMQTLHNLRKLFVQDLSQRVKRAAASSTTTTATGESDGENDVNAANETGGSVVQRQKISFLESNLDQLTKVHKQLVRDNADLRCELPKLEKRLRSTMERVKALESALKESKEGAMRDRKRYQYEMDRIKEVVRQKNLQRRTHAAQIVKPIRAGHNPNAMVNAVTNVIRPVLTVDR